MDIKGRLRTGLGVADRVRGNMRIPIQGEASVLGTQARHWVGNGDGELEKTCMHVVRIVEQLLQSGQCRIGAQLSLMCGMKGRLLRFCSPFEVPLPKAGSKRVEGQVRGRCVTTAVRCWSMSARAAEQFCGAYLLEPPNSA